MGYCYSCQCRAAVVTTFLLTTFASAADVQVEVIYGNKKVSSVSSHADDVIELDCVVALGLSVSGISLLKWQRLDASGKSRVPVSSTPRSSKNYALDQRLEVTVTSKNSGNYFCVATDSNKNNVAETIVSVGVDGKWSEWGPWSECSSDCNSGPRTRARTCSDPAPVHGGKFCVGSSSENGTCCTSGHWMEWTSWTRCQNGHMSRTRQCFGSTCSESKSSQRRPCTSHTAVIPTVKTWSPGSDRSNLVITVAISSSSVLVEPIVHSKTRSPGSDPSNLVITVAISSALVGLLLCIAIIACWRRLHLEQRGTNQRSEDDDATHAMLLSLTDSGPGISADDYPEDPALSRELDAVPPGVALFHSPGSFAEALQGIPPPPNPFFVQQRQQTTFSNSSQEQETQAGDGQGNEENSSTDQNRQDLQSPEDEFAHLKEGITEDELPVLDNDGDVAPIAIL